MLVDFVASEGGSVPEERVLAVIQQKTSLTRSEVQQVVRICINAGALQRIFCGANGRWPVLELPP